MRFKKNTGLTALIIEYTFAEINHFKNLASTITSSRINRPTRLYNQAHYLGLVA
jgi:hypothetical protein